MIFGMLPNHNADYQNPLHPNVSGGSLLIWIFRDPRRKVRDFRGISGKSFDGRGNFALGIKEQIIFPEINYDRVDQIRGMDIVICTTANSDKEARELLRQFNMPFSN